MTHLGFIAAAYGLAVLLPGGLALHAKLRLQSARRRLAALDRR